MKHFLAHHKKYLQGKVPEGAIPVLLDLLDGQELVLQGVKYAGSYYGRFKAGPTRLPCIVMRTDLNPYHFLYIFIHEFAHYFVWQKHKKGKRLKPHGDEWRSENERLLELFLGKDIFPTGLERLIQAHTESGFAGRKTRLELTAAFIAFNIKDVKVPESDATSLLQDLKVGDCFGYNKQFYKVIKFNRTRVLCKRFLTDKKMYSFYKLLAVKKAFQQ